MLPRWKKLWLLLQLLLWWGPKANVAVPLFMPVDLSHPVAEGKTLSWPTSMKFSFTVDFRGTFEKKDNISYYYEANSFAQSEHSGTHMDAPAHFYRGSWRIGDIPFQRLSGPAVVVDIRKKATINPDALLEVADLEQWESTHGPIPEGAVVILRSGRSHFYLTSPNEYFGYPEGAEGDTEQMHFPGFSPEAATWLVENRTIVGVGLDTPSMDYGQSRDFQVHQILGKANIWGLENLANLEMLTESGYTIHAMVMNLESGSGGPARVLAMPSTDQQLESYARTPASTSAATARTTEWMLSSSFALVLLFETLT